MPNIDLTRLITADAKTALKAEEIRAAAKAECRRRIYTVCSEVAQMNLAAACAAGLLSSEDLVAYRAGLAWVAAMRAAWPEIAASGADPAEDANWPTVPAGVAGLAAAF